MPWNERTQMDERVRFIAALSSCEYTMTELCEVFGISRKTGYKWADRYLEEGVEGLADRSRAARTCPHRTDERCERALVEARKKHPHWGARKLLVILARRQPDWPWPAASTGSEILKRHGLVQPRRRRRRPEPPSKPLVSADAPNDLWTTDYKGEFRMGDRRYCYPMTVTDLHSRFLLGCGGKTSTAHDETRPEFEKLFEKYGLPGKILSDGGSPFSSAQSVRRLSRLSVWWIRLGIEPILIQPGRPDQNGSHERMHRTLKAETARPPEGNLRAQQRRFDRFRKEFNEERPHEALDMRPPSELYRPSPRPYPSKLPELPYPGHFEIRRVRPKGEIMWKGQYVFVSEVLARETVGLEEIDDGIWSLYFGSLLLGRYDQREENLDLL
jgi:transposase InsO family protein